MPADCESSELLRAIAKQTTDAEQMGCVALKVRDWDSLLNLAHEHRVLPMLFFDSRTSARRPPARAKSPANEYQRNMFHGLANAAELIAVLKAFDHEMIPAMPFKGVVLGASAYHDLTRVLPAIWIC